MSAIFLSYSRQDGERAAQVKRWLDARGHSVFLDTDVEQGIQGGADWERTLYERLQTCQAVIPLVSPGWLASKWCFAELVCARASGKTIVPLRIEACDGQTILSDLQSIDLTDDAGDAWERLERALEAVFPWNRERPPYPGLSAYTEDDAAVFFGREPETLSGLEQLESLRRRGRYAPRLLLVLGASGSGKSSLVRAGFIPRLRRSRDWIVAPPLRPGARPLDELAVALSVAYADSGGVRRWEDIVRACLSADAESDGGVLLTCARDLQAQAKRPGATVLLVIDQAEELFSGSDSVQANACLRLLRAALDRSDAELIVLATVRSDYLGAFQRHPFLQESTRSGPLAYDQLTIDPMPASRIPVVIRGPAGRAGVQVEPQLVERLTADIRTAAWAGGAAEDGGASSHEVDALPLLAFTLRRLWDTEAYREDNLLELHEYEHLGGLAGAIVHVVGETLALASATADELRVLRAAFIPALVRVTADGVPTRRRAWLAELPPETRPILRKLVDDARLLVVDRDRDDRETIEVAHEAVFRMWPLLARWLDEDRDKLRLIEGVRASAREWDATGRRADLIVHREGRLAEAVALLHDAADVRFASALDAVSKSYLEACRDAEAKRTAAAEEERQRQVRDARTIVRRTRIGLAAASALAVLLLVAFGIARRNESLAEDQSRLVLAAHLLETDPSSAGLVLREVTQPRTLRDLRRAALDVLARPLARAELRHGGPVVWTDVSHDGRFALTASRDSTAVIWPVDGGQPPLRLAHGAGLLRAAFDAQARRIVTTARDGTARVWNLDGQPATPPLLHSTIITDVAFSPMADRIVTGSFDGLVRVWSIARPDEPIRLGPARPGVPIVSVAFDRSGTRVLGASEDSVVRLWRLAAGATDAPQTCAHGLALAAAWFDAGLDAILLVSRSGEALRWVPAASTSGCALQRLIAPGAPTAVSAVAYAAAQLVMFRADRTIAVWQPPFTAPRLTVNGPAGVLRDVSLAARGDRFVAGYTDGSARVWSLREPGPPSVLAGHGGPVMHVSASDDGSIVVTGSEDGTARLWYLGDSLPETERFVRELTHSRNVTAIDITPRGDTLVTAAQNGQVRRWLPDGSWIQPRFGDNTSIVLATFGRDHLLWLARDGDVRLLRRDDWQGTPRMLTDEQERSRAIYAAFSPGGERIVTTSDDGTVRIWSTRDAGPPQRLRGHTPGVPVTRATFHPDGTIVATASDDGTARVWNTQRDPTESRVLRHPDAVRVRGVVFHPDGTRLLTFAGDDTVRIWDITRPDSLPRHRLAHTAPVRTAAFSRDGRRLLTGTDEGIAWIWEPGSDRPPLRLIGHQRERAIVAATFSPDGELVLTASEDGTARIWNADGSGEPVVLARHTSALSGALFTPSGERVVTASTDSRAFIWDIAPARLLEVIGARTRLCLRPDFRVRYFLEKPGRAEAASRACEVAGRQPRTS